MVSFISFWSSRWPRYIRTKEPNSILKIVEHMRCNHHQRVSCITPLPNCQCRNDWMQNTQRSEDAFFISRSIRKGFAYSTHLQKVNEWESKDQNVCTWIWAHKRTQLHITHKSSSDFWKSSKTCAAINTNRLHASLHSLIVNPKSPPLPLCLLTGYKHRSDSTNKERTAPPQFAWLQVPTLHLPPPRVCQGPLRPWCDLRVGQWICTNKCNVKSPADRRASKSGWPQQCTTL